VLSALGIHITFLSLLPWILMLACWMWAIIDVLRRRFTNPSNKVVWFCVVFFLNLPGALVYLFAGRKYGNL